MRPLSLFLLVSFVSFTTLLLSSLRLPICSSRDCTDVSLTMMYLRIGVGTARDEASRRIEAKPCC
jgi:hypothetical protein